jgi:hypothetical protein
MLGKRPPWMIKAVAGSLVCLAALVIYSIGFGWLYGKLAPLAPDWMTGPRGRNGFSIFETGSIFAYAGGALLLVLGGGGALFHRLGVPFEAFLPGGTTPDYPRNRSRRSANEDEA